jgi:hypothetical protein
MSITDKRTFYQGIYCVGKSSYYWPQEVNCLLAVYNFVSKQGPASLLVRICCHKDGREGSLCKLEAWHPGNRARQRDVVVCAMHRHTRLTTLLLPVSLYCISTRHKGLSSAIVSRNKGFTLATDFYALLIWDIHSKIGVLTAGLIKILVI